jgi:hypothetical protein
MFAFIVSFLALPVPVARRRERQDQAREQPQTINYKPSIPFNAVQRKDFLSMFCSFCKMCCQHWRPSDPRRRQGFAVACAQGKRLPQKRRGNRQKQFPLLYIELVYILNLKQRA